MAEFASAIIGLAGVGAKVGGSLYTLIRTLKHAPNEFLALSDEITDFRSMLSRLLDITASGEVDVVGDGLAKDLDMVRQRGEQIVNEVEVLVTKVSKESGKEVGGNEVKKIQWLRYINQAKSLQERLRAQKVTICNVIVLGMMNSSARNGLRISQLEVKLDMSAERHASLMERQFEMLVEMKGPQKQPTGDPEMGQTFRTTLRPGGASSKGETIMDQRSLVPKQRASSRPGPLRCLRDCQCRCHYRTVMRSPRYMTEWLGDFFLGCTNLPWCFSGLVACSEQTCRRSWGPTVDVGYLLPSWIGQGVGSFAVTFSLRRPPLNICVRTRHTVPYDSPILVCAQEGDVDGARKLLLSGQATINDVDPYGLGLLYYAAYYCWRASGHDAVKMCRFLLDMGASRDWDDEIGNTPKETMIDHTLISLAMGNDRSYTLEADDFVHIGLLFEEPTVNLIEDFVGDRELSTLHQVLLGIDREHGTLEEYLGGLGQCPLPSNIIDTPDACGRTALAWAVEYMWHDAARTLLKYGADARQSRPSFRGSMPLLHLIMAGPVSERGEKSAVDTVALLLEHGADANGVDHEGWTPLHVAASWNNLAVVRELARFTGGALAWDAMTDDNESAIELALGAGFHAEVQAILQRRGVEDDVDSEADEFFDCVAEH